MGIKTQEGSNKDLGCCFVCGYKEKEEQVIEIEFNDLSIKLCKKCREQLKKVL